ncbi:MAG: UbiA family prenyltransferase [Phycisphaeraceae bacterium]
MSTESTTTSPARPSPPSPRGAAPRPRVLDVVRAVRPHQWSKNLLLLVPLALAHGMTDWYRLGMVLLGLVVFNLAASAGYVLNDVLDVQADRMHPTKFRRPFASGRLSRRTGWVMLAGLLVVAAGLAAAWLPPRFGAILAIYLTGSISYSTYWKRKLVIDTLVLAGLYTLRLYAGAAAAEVFVSHWLLAFSVFWFLSLALLKRYVELRQKNLDGAHPQETGRRGYWVSDEEMVRALGPVPGYMALMLMAVYLNSDKVNLLYQSPELLWGVCLLLAYWITRLWILAARGVVSDPLTFSLRDRAAWLVLLGVGVLLALAATADLPL